MISGAMRTASATRDYYKNHKEKKIYNDSRNSNERDNREKGKEDNRQKERGEGNTPQNTRSDTSLKAHKEQTDNREEKGNNTYFKEAMAEWQGKLAKERFPAGEFKYDDFVKVVDENDRFRTFDLNFSVSKDIAVPAKKRTEFKKVFKQSVSKVVEQVQVDMKIKFKKSKTSKQPDIRIRKRKTGEQGAKVESHKVAKKNVSKIQKSLEPESYRSMFQEEMVKGLKEIGIRANEDQFNISRYVNECTVAWDCVCQAPKSVSLSLMFPEHYDRILKCHEVAVEAAMKFVEENYIVSRMQVNGINHRELTHNMLSAKFTEFYNRDLQPHLHSHNVIFNTTRNPLYIRERRGSREFLSVFFKAIYDNYDIIDGVYKSRLSEELRKERYELVHDKHNLLNFEIAGFTREQVLHFSRVLSIDKKLEEMGTNREQSNARQRNTANLMTRKEKVHVDIDTWREQVLREMEEMGIQSPKLYHERGVEPSLDMSETDLKKVLRKASDDFFYSNAAFTRQEYIKGVLERAGDVLPSLYVEEYFDKSRRFINLGELKGKTYFSVRENIRVENGIYQYIANGKNKRKHIIKEAKVERFLKYSNLKENQKEAVRFMATCRDRVAAIQGDPGVGKSFMLNKAREIFEKEHYQVFGIAPSNQAALTLREKTGLRAATLHSFFIRLQDEAGTWEEGRNPLDLRQTDFSGLAPGKQDELWIVDESSLIDNYTMSRLLEAAELKNAYVVLTGDKGQLPPVESGRPFYNMITDGKVPYVEVKEMMRQKESWQVFNAGELSWWNLNRVKNIARKEGAMITFFDSSPFDYIPAERVEILKIKRGVEVAIYKDRSVKEAVQHVVDGNVLESLNLLEGRIHEVRNDKERIERIAEFYSSLSVDERAVTTIITSTNRDREAINNNVREMLKAKGELGEAHVFEVTGSKNKSQVKEFAPGDKVIFLRKAKLSGHYVMKNDMGIIRKIENVVQYGAEKDSGDQKKEYKKITVESKNRRIVFNTDEYNRIDHIFCSTTYKVQSSSDRRIIANFDTKQYNVNSINDYVTKISRSEGEVIIFTDDRRGLYDAVKNEHSRVSINDFSEDGFKIHEITDTEEKAQLLKEITGQFEYENAAFSKAEFVKGACDIYEDMVAAGEATFFLTEADFEADFKKGINKRHYIEVGERNKVVYFSTSENIKVEKEIYKKAASGRNQIAGFNEARVHHYIEHSTLNHSQQEVLLFVTMSKDGIRAVQAAPGSGIPFLLNVSKHFYESEGNYKVVAFAPSNRAVSTLKEKAGFEDVYTIHSYLIKLQKEAGTWEANRDPLDLRLVNLSGLTRGSHREIWFVDKSSLLDNFVMNKLFEAAELKHAEVVLIGGRTQMQPVGAGRPFTNLIDEGRIEYITLNEIQRQQKVWQVFECGKITALQQNVIMQRASKENAAVNFFNHSPTESISPEQLEILRLPGRVEVEIFKDSSLKEAVEHLVDGNISESIEVISESIIEDRDDERRIEKVAQAYGALSPSEREQTAIVTGTNRDRERINDYVRETLKLKGELGEGHVFEISDNRDRTGVREFAPGDEIIFLKKTEIDEYPVTKDDTGIIKKIELDTPENENNLITIETKGKQTIIDPSKYNSIDHAYCSTTYKVMSSSGYKRVLAHIDTKQYNINSMNDFLVKLSGAAVEISIFTDNRKGLYDSVKREQDKVSINDFLDKNSLELLHDGQGTKTPVERTEKEELIAFISGKFEYRNAAFTRDDFVKGTMAIFTDMVEIGETDLKVSNADFKKQFDEKFDTGEFIEVGRLDEIIYFSTFENIKIENEIYKEAEAARNQVTGFNRAQVRLYLEHTTLNSGQKDALLFVTTSKDRIRAIQGAPGVGKSFMLNAAKNFYEEQDYRVMALAPSNKAVLNLKETAGFEDAATIHSYLIKLQKEAGTWTTGRDPLDLRLTDLEGLTPGVHKEIWFVDEASLIDNYTMNRLLEAARLKNVEVIPIGDINQLQPVGQGRPFTNMLREDMLKYVEVKEILRQKEEWRVYQSDRMSKADKDDLLRQADSLENNAAVVFIKGNPPENAMKGKNPETFRMEHHQTASRIDIEIHKDSTLLEAVKDAVDHNIGRSLNKLDTRIREIGDNADRLETIAEKYTFLSDHARDNTVIITATNKDRIAVNELVREFLKHNGDLREGYNFSVTDIVGKKHIREFSPGDKIIFLKKEVIGNHLLSKDDVGVVKEISGKDITVSTRGKDVVIQADKYNHFDHAYCRTTYRVQGADYDTVYANINTYQKLINSKNDFLVKISRSKHKLELYTDNLSRLYYAVRNEQFKVSISDFLDRVYVKDASKIVDDRVVDQIYNRKFENTSLPWKIKTDLQRGDFHYTNYYRTMEKAVEYRRKAKSFSDDKEKFQGLHEKFESTKEKALEHQAKSETYYQRAADNYARKFSNRMDEAATLSPGNHDLTREKASRLKEEFVKKYIPVGDLCTLEKITSGNSPFIELESKLSIESESYAVGNEYAIDSPGIGSGEGPESPGFDGPGADIDIPGGDHEDGGIDGPGISFDI